MAKQITFPGKENKEEAKEYARVMKARGWDVLMVYDRTQKAYIVHVSEIKEGRRIPEEKIPRSIAEVVSMAEEDYPEGTRGNLLQNANSRTRSDKSILCKTIHH